MWQILYVIAMVLFGGTALVGDICALVLWARAQKYAGTLQAAEKSLKFAESNAAAWKGNYDASELQRREQRERADVLNSQILRLTEENAIWKNKTDLSPVLLFQKEQTQVNKKLVESLDSILTRLSQLATPEEMKARAKLTRKKGK